MAGLKRSLPFLLMLLAAAALRGEISQASAAAEDKSPREPQSIDVFPLLPSPRFLKTGERQVIDLVVANPGDELNFYTLSIQKKPEGWLARIDPSHVDLRGHEKQPIHITMIPRRGPPTFTEQTQYDILIKAEDKTAKSFYGTLPVYLKPGGTDLVIFFGTPMAIGFLAIGFGGWLRRRKIFRVGGLFVMGGGILTVVAITAVLGILMI